MKYVLPFFICALFASCFNEGDCLITATNYVRIQFKKKTDHTKDMVVTFAYPHSIEVIGEDTILQQLPTSQILLPLNLTQYSTSTTFILHRIDSTDTANVIYSTDTLRISYEKQTKVISKDCGAYTYYQNLKVTKKETDGDSLEIKSFSTSLIKDPTASAIAPTSYALNFQIFY